MRYVKDSNASVFDAYGVMANCQPMVMKAESLWDYNYLAAKGYYILNESTKPVVNSWDSIAEGTPLRSEVDGVVTYLQQWVVVEPSLAEAKAVKLREIEYYRNVDLRGEGSTVTTNTLGFDVVWQTDDFSMKTLSKALVTFGGLGEVPEGFAWRDYNNTNQVVSLADLFGIAGARAVVENELFLKSWGLKEVVEASSSIPEVAAVTW